MLSGNNLVLQIVASCDSDEHVFRQRLSATLSDHAFRPRLPTTPSDHAFRPRLPATPSDHAFRPRLSAFRPRLSATPFGHVFRRAIRIEETRSVFGTLALTPATQYIKLRASVNEHCLVFTSEKEACPMNLTDTRNIKYTITKANLLEHTDTKSCEASHQAHGTANVPPREA